MSWIISMGETKKNFSSEQEVTRYIMKHALELLHDTEYHKMEDRDQTLRSLDTLKHLGLYPDLHRLVDVFNGTKLFRNNLGELCVWYEDGSYDSCDCPSLTDLINDVLRVSI